MFGHKRNNWQKHKKMYKHKNHNAPKRIAKRESVDITNVKFGTLPIHKANFDFNHHPNIVVKKQGDKWLSVGIQSSPKSGGHKLKPVIESNRQKGYLQHHVNERTSYEYKEIPETWHVDIDSEERAKSMVKHYENKK